MNIFLGIMIPFAGTALGAACVFLLKNDIRAGVRESTSGFRVRHYGGRLCVVTFNSCYGNV